METKLTQVTLRAIPAVSHHLRTCKSGTVSTKTSSVFQQRQGQGPGRAKSQNGTPSSQPSVANAGPNGRGFMPDLRLRQLAQKILALTTNGARPLAPESSGGCLFCNPPTCKDKRDDVACPRSFDRNENHMDERSMLPGAHRISGRTTTQFVFVFTRQSVPVFVKDPFHKVKFSNVCLVCLGFPKCA